MIVVNKGLLIAIQNNAMTVANYSTAAGLVWVIHPQEEQVDAFVTGQPVQILTLADNYVLIGFELSVSDIFSDMV